MWINEIILCFFLLLCFCKIRIPTIREICMEMAAQNAIISRFSCVSPKLCVTLRRSTVSENEIIENNNDN